MTLMRTGGRALSRTRAAAILGLAVLIAAGDLAAGPARAAAQSLIPGPSDPGYDATLDQLADAYDRQIHGLLTTEYGLTLTAIVNDPTHRAMIDDFIASGQRDFLAESGHHPYEVIDEYGEQGDLGMFGGVTAGGDAFRYAVLRNEGAPAAQVDEARTALLAAMDGLHWQMEVTGTPGVLARGIERITPAAGDPPLPDAVHPTTPLFDASGNPLPATKDGGVWRADNSGHLPFLEWLDDCSKDQLIGWVFAIGAVYDVVAGDPTIPTGKIDALVGDARALGQALMTRHTNVALFHNLDLNIIDADGRPADFGDLNAAVISPGVVTLDESSANGFNAWMALSIIRTLLFITGDADLHSFYYTDLIGTRDYLSCVDSTLGLMYLGTKTNFSNVNMAFVAAYGVLRYEDDPTVGTRLREVLTSHLYAPGVDRQPQGLGQTFFDVIYAAFQAGSRSLGATAMAQGIETLREFPAPPYWSPAVVNCDAGEISAGSCLAIDGATPITLDSMTGHNGIVVATEPLPERLRPPTNFTWRDDPYQVNSDGGASNWLNPGGGFHAAYWMGRFLRDPATPFDNVSPGPPPPGSLDGGVAADAGSGDAGVGVDAGMGAGMDAGMGAGVDAGMGAGVDAGMGAGVDAGMGAGVDAGTGAGVDAGMGAGMDAGMGAGVDAGMRSGGGMGCGCSAAGRTGSGAAGLPLAVLLLGLLGVVTRLGRRRPQ